MICAAFSADKRPVSRFVQLPHFIWYHKCEITFKSSELFIVNTRKVRNILPPPMFDQRVYVHCVPFIISANVCSIAFMRSRRGLTCVFINGAEDRVLRSGVRTTLGGLGESVNSMPVAQYSCCTREQEQKCYNDRQNDEPS